MSWIGVITNAGQAVLERWSSGDHTLTIDGATVGGGYVEEANMRIATDLAHTEDSASIVRAEEITDGTRFKVQIGAAETTAYTAHEVGLWAHLDDENSVLLSLHQDATGGIPVPAQSVSPDFAFSMYIVHAIVNDGSLSITVDTSAYVSMSSLVETAPTVELTDDEVASIYASASVLP